jgi:hypothetical protein
MANGGDKSHHGEKKVGRKESHRQSKKGTVDRVKEQSTTKERTQ